MNSSFKNLHSPLLESAEYSEQRADEISKNMLIQTDEEQEEKKIDENPNQNNEKNKLSFFNKKSENKPKVRIYCDIAPRNERECIIFFFSASAFILSIGLLAYIITKENTHDSDSNFSRRLRI